MNKLIPFLALTALTVSLPAFAQEQATPAPDPAAAAPPMAPAPPSALTSSTNTSTGPVSADQLPPGQANALAAGDNQTVTNGPVPDTKANRAKFGGPMSNAGRHTKPVGN